MRLLLLSLVLVGVTAVTAHAGGHCPPGYVVARYSFGIWTCALPVDPRLACPPGKRLAADHWGTPKCVWYRPRPVERR